MKEPKLIDAEKQYYLALNAFNENGFFILINNEQYTNLEEVITIHENLCTIHSDYCLCRRLKTYYYDSKGII